MRFIKRFGEWSLLHLEPDWILTTQKSESSDMSSLTWQEAVPEAHTVNTLKTSTRNILYDFEIDLTIQDWP